MSVVAEAPKAAIFSGTMRRDSAAASAGLAIAVSPSAVRFATTSPVACARATPLSATRVAAVAVRCSRRPSRTARLIFLMFLIF